MCCAGSRLLVEESCAEAVIQKLKDRMRTLRVGDPLDKNTDVGAINSKMQLDKITELVASGEKEGATRFTPSCALPNKGYWFIPTMFTDVSQSHRIAREEIFGPVLSVMTFRTPDEALEKANNTMYGLSAGVWTDKGSKSFWMATRLKASVDVGEHVQQVRSELAVRRLQRAASAARAAGRACSLTSRSTDGRAEQECIDHGAAGGPEPRPRLARSKRRAGLDPQGLQDVRGRRVPGARSESGRYTQVAETKGSTSMENVPRASRKDGRDAVVAARAALDGWSARTAFNRGQILYRLAEMLDARKGELATSLVRGGLADDKARAEVDATIDRAIAYAGWTDKYQSLFSSLNPVGGPHFNFTSPEPMGVVAIAAPTRPALLGLAGAILPVIASGNTCVVLASEADPRTAVTFTEALATSDLPGGVVNVLTGQLAEVLPHLAKHMEIAALDLHGVDSKLCKSLEEAAVDNVKRVRVRALDEAAWFDAAAAESPRWIERFVEMKTVWHPAGP